jgi:glycerophosphoryl diester phosphodiesterase
MNALDWLVSRPIAHRGLHARDLGVIENSPAAFSAAIASGYAIECDVQLSADGEAMVFHDFDLDRLTGEAGRVIDRRADDLRRVALSGSATEDGMIPLRDLIRLVAGSVPLVVEIKSRFDGDLRLTRRVVETLDEAPENVALKSFDPRIVAALRMLAPRRARGIVAMSAYAYPDYDVIPPAEKHSMANLLHFSETSPDFISWHVKDLPHGCPYLCRQALGLPVMTWTVRTEDDVARAQAHADQMVFEGFRPSTC